MSLRNELLKYDTVFIDSAPIIYLVEQHAVYLPLMRGVVTLMRADKMKIVTSPITLLECLIQPFQTDDERIQQRFRDVIVNGRNITFVSTNAEIGERAATIRVKYNLSATDAIQVATAIESNCGALLTNDKSFARITEIPILRLDSYLTP